MAYFDKEMIAYNNDVDIGSKSSCTKNRVKIKGGEMNGLSFNFNIILC